MAAQPPPQDSQSQALRKKQELSSSRSMALAIESVKFSLLTGTAGVLAGVGGAIARDTNPVVNGFTTGVQWAGLGTGFYVARFYAARIWGKPDQMKSSDKIIVSAIAGTTTGAVSGLLRGPTKILPAMLIWGLLGAGGQMLINRYEGNQLKPKTESGPGFWSRFNPLKKLTDEEYMDMMREKKLKLDVDISLIDDRIAELRRMEHRAREAEGVTAPKQN